jgi:signal transduction histidine kinase
MAIRSAISGRLGGQVSGPVVLTVAGALFLGVGSSMALAIGSGVDPVHAVLIYCLTVSYGAGGLAAWWHRPGSRFGPLMIVTGFSTLASTLVWQDNGVANTIGQAVDLLPLVLVLHVFLAFPSGRLDGWVERVLVGVGYVAAVGGQLAVMLLGGLGPGHVLGVVEQPDVAEVLYNVDLVVIACASLAGVAVLAVRRKVRGRPLRRSLSMLIDSFALGLVMIAVLLLVGVAGGPPFPTVQRISLTVLALAPVAFLIGLLNARMARLAVGDLVVELQTDPADLRSPLARALGDPSLTLAYWLPQFASWVDQSGAAVTLPTDGSRTVTMIERGGDRVAALVHNPALTDEAELLDAVSAAAALALENGRLQAELRANLEELRGSRARVIAAGQKERQRLERDLHDGAQQRLVALSLDLGLLESRLGAEAKEPLGRARQEIAVSLEELRDVARGLHPAVLSAHGLGVALESLAARATVPVRLTVALPERLDESVEVAAYFVVCESLANIAKHAQASSAEVEVARTGGQVVVEVVDDGVGGADTENGTGLRGLADRVEALGGRLRVWTPRGGGTRVRAELPCG